MAQNTVLDKLASAQNIRNTESNKELAKQITGTGDKKAVAELIANLNNKAVQSDCIKVLYEIGDINPALITNYAPEFLSLLDSKNNRMQWGAMTALDMIAAENAALIYESLGKIMAIADKGSVITKDHCVGILIKLCTHKRYAADAFALFITLLQQCPPNQVPMYAEQALPVITKDNKEVFIRTLQARLPDIEKEPKKRRIEKVIKKLK